MFTPFLEDGFEIAKALGVEFYHAGSKKHPISLEERRDMYSRWITGTHEGLVASTLAAGNDYAHVRIAAHLGNPHEMVTFVQQSGRAGRGGKPALSILIPKGKRVQNNVDNDDDESADLCGKQAMDEYIWPEDPELPYCLQKIMSRFLDTGSSYTCDSFGLESELCGMCTEGEKQ